MSNIASEQNEVIRNSNENKGTLVENNFYGQVRDKQDYWKEAIITYLNSLSPIEDKYGEAIDVQFSPLFLFAKIKFEAEYGHRYHCFNTKKLINTVAVELDREQRIKYIYNQIFNLRSKLMKSGYMDILYKVEDIAEKVLDINEMYNGIDENDIVKKQNLDLRIYRAIIKVNKVLNEARKKYAYIDTSNPKLENYQMRKRPIYYLAGKE